MTIDRLVRAIRFVSRFCVRHSSTTLTHAHLHSLHIHTFTLYIHLLCCIHTSPLFLIHIYTFPCHQRKKTCYDRFIYSLANFKGCCPSRRWKTLDTTLGFVFPSLPLCKISQDQFSLQFFLQIVYNCCRCINYVYFKNPKIFLDKTFISLLSQKLKTHSMFPRQNSEHHRSHIIEVKTTWYIIKVLKTHTYNYNQFTKQQNRVMTAKQSIWMFFFGKHVKKSIWMFVELHKTYLKDEK